MSLNSPHNPIVTSCKFANKSGLSDHADFCMGTDRAVGEVLNTLEKLKISDKTLLVFTADNGTYPLARFTHMEEQGVLPKLYLQWTQRDY